MNEISSLDSKEDEIDSTLCKICVKSQSKYTCPRCGISYCSVACYQSKRHANCSEDFYRQCVLEEMKQEVGDTEAEKRMKEILQRLHESQEDEVGIEDLDSEDECEPDLADRMCNVNLDDPDSVWEKLTDNEKQEFAELVKSGDATKLLPAWKPWWNFRREKKLIVEVESSSTASAEESEYLKNCPELMKNIQPLSHVTKTLPSPVVKNNVQNILAAYCYVCRWFNGEHHSFATEAAQTLLTLSCNLSQGNNYTSSEMAIDAVTLQVSSCGWLDSSPESVMLMHQDLNAVLTGPEDDNVSFYVMAALSDAHDLLYAAAKSKVKPVNEKEFSRQFPDYTMQQEGAQFSKENIKQCAKKLEYYISWTIEHGTEICGLRKNKCDDEILTTDVDLDSDMP